MLILGIESSCDETGIAIYDSANGKLLSDSLYSQIKLHQDYGGVVPELASREHIAKLYSLTKDVLSKAKLSLKDIDCIAYTFAPGLVGALMVGATFAKSVGFIYDIPTVPIHHLEGHLLSPLLDEDSDIQYPYLALLVSGGHTQLFEVSKFAEYRLLGESIDDAIGEAFDKTAKLLGMSYPGGVEVARFAELAIDKKRYILPRPMKNSSDLNFSFSGLKTAVLNAWQNEKLKTEENKANLCYAFQEAAIDVIVHKCEKALGQAGFRRLVVSGGVSANIYLRESLNKMAKDYNFQIFFPPLKYCTDNGAMIALAGGYRYCHRDEIERLDIEVFPRYKI
ncbi:tRNA (adenosine(37)-N6)-threonylcarbamoyltransferase complex transferase subunit TsaD [Pseudofrancisella aestuarii]|uniref:tRNA N6-adenosine threonylcarbamoyltransferase n=1 Tax=Pseudofrancisella aestuarii TaxID=2670347 RepID=A0ABV9TE72_9GAMM|nr:tRNA (adenosine(37)-N6)-threonylcarbamoyltransferase complex transferase subunit TsaD [Pseudofrancisella aestuarii]